MKVVMGGRKGFEPPLVLVANAQDSPCPALATSAVPEELLCSEDKAESWAIGAFSHEHSRYICTVAGT